MPVVIENNKPIGLESTVEDLCLTPTTIRHSDKLLEVSELFDKNPSLTGLIVLKNHKYYRLLSRNRFFKSMSNQFMFDLYLKRSVSSYLEDNHKEDVLIIPRYTTILNAANMALKRCEGLQRDPLVVEFENGEVKLLDFYHLLLAQIHVHTLTLNLLKGANEFKKEVLSIIAHDLRTPIGTIIGFSEELKEHSFDTESTAFLEFINTAAKQINELVNELLRSVVNDSAHFELNVSNFKINEIIDAVIFSLNKNLLQKQQKMLFDSLNQQVEIEADKLKIKEVIENLLTNAIKYSDFGKTTSVFLEEYDSFVQIVIKDQGQGFTELDLEKIFGKFQRLSAKPTNGESSTGLGLYLVKQIINQHKGEVIVTSRVGIGTSFTISLPKFYKE